MSVTPPTDPRPSLRGRLAWTTLAVLLGTTVAFGWMSRERPSVDPPPPVTPPTTVTSDGVVSLTTRVDRTAVHQGGDGTVNVEVRLSAAERALVERTRRATDLVVVLDRSGSMNGAKIEQAKRAVRDLVERLDARDRFALVSFNSLASLDIPLQPATPEQRRDWDRRVTSIGAGGGTCIGCALRTGLDHLESQLDAGRSSRVILLSDGLDATDGLVELAARAPRREYVLSTIGVGLDFNEQLLTSMADSGTGNFYFLDDVAVLGDVFRGELEATQETVASAVALTVRPGEGVEVVSAAGYPLERDGQAVVLRPGTLFAGQQRSIWLTCRVPTGTRGEHALGSVALSYKSDGAPQAAGPLALSRVTCLADERAVIASYDRDAWRQNVLNEQFGKLQQAISSALKEGRRSDALEAVAEFEERTREVNAELADEDVAEKLEEAESLRQELDAAFAAPAAVREQVAKDHQVKGLNARRAGAKKVEVK